MHVSLGLLSRSRWVQKRIACLIQEMNRRAWFPGSFHSPLLQNAREDAAITATTLRVGTAVALWVTKEIFGCATRNVSVALVPISSLSMSLERHARLARMQGVLGLRASYGH